MRCEFEKLPEIADKLDSLWFYEAHNFYGVLDESPQTAMKANFINGAWMAYQEQQKKIDAALELGYKTRRDVHYLVDEYIDDVEGLLK